MAQASKSQITRRTIEFVQENASTSFSIEDIAAHVGYSESGLRHLFRKQTGKSLGNYILDQRMLRAKELLRETDSKIAEIALRTGFNEPDYFCVQFKKRVGYTPTAYRTQSRSAGPAPTKQGTQATGLSAREFRDSFDGAQLGACWRPYRGVWTQEKGVVASKSGGDQDLVFEQQLPDNFRITFESLFFSTSELPASDLRVSLRNADATRAYCNFAIGALSNTVGRMVRQGSSVQWNSRAVIRIGEWQQSAVELRDDVLSYVLDGKEAFQYRDPFLPAYASRCRFVFGSWQSWCEFRRFKMVDLGAPGMVSAIRQGDSLYNAGLFNQAEEFYVRQLGLAVDNSDTMELYYKIGMCFLREADYEQASAWTGKLEALPRDSFWAQHASLARLELMLQVGDSTGFCQQARKLFHVPALQGAVRLIAGQAGDECRRRGLHVPGLELRQTISELEEAGSTQGEQSRLSLAESLRDVGRCADAEKLLREIIRHKNLPAQIRLSSLYELAYLLPLLGKHEEAEGVVEDIGHVSKSKGDWARSQVYLSFALRGQGRVDDANRTLDRVIAESTANGQRGDTHALLTKGELLWPAGRTQDALAAIEDAKRVGSGNALFTGYGPAHYEYPALLPAERFAEAGEMLLRDSRVEGNRVAARAQQALKAGVMFELANKKPKAEKIWSEMTERFPAERCGFYGSLAGRLMEGQKGDLTSRPLPRGEEASGLDEIENMRCPPLERSEIAYVVGLLMEKRGNTGRAQELFKLAWDWDLSLRWPAWLAKRKLSK